MVIQTMSSWAKMLKNFERMSGGMTRGTPGAIKFLKTNPTRHQVLAYAKKAADRLDAVSRPEWARMRAHAFTNAGPNFKNLEEERKRNVYDEFQDAIRIVQDSMKELGISPAFERAFRDVEWGFNDPKLMKRQLRKFYTQYKKEMAKPNRNYVKVDFNVVLAAEKWKIRLTKDGVNGKRVKRTESELKKLIENKKKACKARHGKNHRYCNK